MKYTAKIFLIIMLALSGTQYSATVPAAAATTSTDQPAISEAAGTMQRITVRGSDLFRGEERFRVFGVQNLNHNFEREFYTNGSAELRAKMTSGFDAARSMGFNTMRVHLQLFDFIGRDVNGVLFARQNSFDNFAALMSITEKVGMYLLVSGNNVWLPDEVPAWYDQMSYRDRWEVQAFFFEQLAAAGSGSPSILAYELTSEPTIRVDGKSVWYSGELGGFWFSQAIAIGVPRGQVNQVARDWINRLTSAIRKHDPDRPITIGVNATFTGGALGIENTAPLLDILSPHIYPKITDPEFALRSARRFALSGKPVVVGETHFFTSNEKMYRDFFVTSAPLVDGYISFFDGREAQDMITEKKDAQAIELMVQKTNLMILQDLRAVILGK